MQMMRSTAPRALVTWCVLISLAILTASCKTTDSGVVTTSTDSVRVACSSFEPIYWSGSDTLETIAQAKEHNAAGKALCGWGVVK